MVNAQPALAQFQPSFEVFTPSPNPYGLHLLPPAKSADEVLDCFDDGDVEPEHDVTSVVLRTPDDIHEKNIALYPFQKIAIAEIENGFFVDRLRSQRLILPTGTGKTRCFSTFTKRRIADGGRVLILVHRNDLLRQAQEKLSEIGVFPLIEQGESRALAHFGDQFRTVIASVQSLHRDRVRLWPRDSFDWIISDEAHHVQFGGKSQKTSSSSNHWGKIAHWFYTAQHLGVTATPGKMKGKRYINIPGWGRDIEPIQLGEAIRQGYLSPLLVKQCKTDIDLRGIGRVFGKDEGDFKQNELDQVIYDNTNKLATAIKEHIEARPTIAFTPLVASAEALCQALNDIGVKAGVVSYKTDDAVPIYEAHKRGDFQVLCNAMKCTEGFDAPYLECVVLAKPTQSVNVYRQCVGRGTRLSKETGKVNCLILDFAFVTGNLPLVGAPQLLGQELENESDEDIEAITKAANDILNSGETVDLLDAVDQAKIDVKDAKERDRIRREIEAREEAKREARRIKNREEQFRYKVTTLDPMATNLLGIPERTTLGWTRTEPLTAAQETQITRMTKGKIKTENMTKETASAILSQLFSDRQNGLCSYPQREVLTRRLGANNLTAEQARAMKFEEASAYITTYKTW